MAFRILGPLEVTIAGQEVPIPAGKHRSLLAALLLRVNSPVSMEELSDYIWSGAPPANARGAVQTYVARLRTSLQMPGLIVTQRDGYSIEMPEFALDLHRFRGLVARAETLTRSGSAAQAALLRQALSLWRGPALANVPSERLRSMAAQSLGEERLNALERRIDAELSLGRHRQMLAELRALTAEHPLHERLQGQLMTALHRSGRYAEALESFRRLRQVLHDELGIEPGEDLQRLHQQMLGGQPLTESDPDGDKSLPAWTAACQLPLGVGTYVGRSELVSEATAQLLHQDVGVVPIVVVGGGPGTGKTAFAVHVAHRVRAAFPDGQWFVRLRTPDGGPRDPADVLAEMLVSAGLDQRDAPDGLGARAARLRALLADRSVLLVLDDAFDATQVRCLLPGTAECAVLITSGTNLWGLAALDDARVLMLEPLQRDEATRLLAGLIGQTIPHGILAEIARLCDDLPLALRLAAANMMGRSPSERARYLAGLRSRDRLSLLAVRGDQAAAVRTSFERSYLTLPAPAQRLFRLLALVPDGDCTLESVAVLLRVPVHEAEFLLETLIAAHLVRRLIPGRFRLDPLLRLYAREQLATEEMSAV
ncbi:AfsR/SARP family transcriptional regulator [Nonomuraea aurantiaca]|uniref:AfsR/SARP family transcriptional regulator n=1 Tax=Nonomuraea aurantiaca TaxID=2878562 RepID=UPI001CDA0A72|nr:AfsR/SARP family transcriptional regulator [Nonomuraea aurantiaca]MCA2228729.1 AfsR/SARP family transcriptional regulator [Nonomuraea aurantiaca]